MRTRAMAVVGLLLLFLLPVIAQASVPAPIGLSSEARAKLGTSLISAIEKQESRTIDVTVVFDHGNTPEYFSRAFERVSGMVLRDTLDTLGAFLASVDIHALSKLVELPFVQRIDEDHEIQLCMNWARLHTSVDSFRVNYPYLDGDLDGQPTVYTPSDIVIAIIDSGIDTNHVDLDGGKVIGWKDYVHGLLTPYDDFAWPYHGTHCASIAAGTGEGMSRYRGVAPGAALVGVKAFDSTGGTTDTWIEASLEWVADHKSTYGIEIVSISWGQESYGQYDSLAILVDRLVTEQGLVVCVAAGNIEDPDHQLVTSPGTGKYVITVGNAIDPHENFLENGVYDWALNPTSRHGPVDFASRTKPDILAPGTDIMAAQGGTSNLYHELTGTSMAAPFVAGLCALWLDRAYSLHEGVPTSSSNQRIKELLMGGATDMPDDTTPGLDNYYGAGRVDANDEDYFFTTDISTYAADAPLVLGYSWYEQTYTRANEPLSGVEYQWRDWYKIYAYAGIFIYIQAWGDPDLILVISIWDTANPQTQVKLAESSAGNDRNLGYTATSSSDYYIRIIVYYPAGSTDLSGDYYDVSITTTPS